MIIVPPGTLLKSAALSEMDMVVRQLRGQALGEMEFRPAELMRLTNDTPQEYFIEAYSLDFSKADPSSATSFFMEQGEGPQVSQVLRVLRAVDSVPKMAGDVVSIQTALWVITDDVDGTELLANTTQICLRYGRYFRRRVSNLNAPGFSVAPHAECTRGSAATGCFSN